MANFNSYVKLPEGINDGWYTMMMFDDWTMGHWLDDAKEMVYIVNCAVDVGICVLFAYWDIGNFWCQENLD